MKLLDDIETYPVLGRDIDRREYGKVDLSAANSQLGEAPSMKQLESYLRNHLSKNKTKIAFGGYLENRNLYRSSSMFDRVEEKRTVHLGIDLWTFTYRDIFVPIDGRVLHAKYNGGHLDYGYTLILGHEIEGQKFYTLYGHLAQNIVVKNKPGSMVRKADFLGEIGKEAENGGWIPHLHFQIILDLQGYVGDYPGVCSLSQLDFYTLNCPDPTKIALPTYD